MTIKNRNKAQVQRIVQDTFGFDALRPGQDAAIKAVLDGHDTLAIMPTGWGKSIIYQIASLLLSGPTVIVSPLIALQRDQVAALEELNIGGATSLNSTLRASEWREAMEDLQQKNLAFLFLAPEQFNHEETIQQLRAVKPALFVVDEAHCISDWGHDFRPDYLRLGAVIESLGHPTILALTATAAPPVREEIVERLGMRETVMISQGFDRPNIWLGVETFHDESQKLQALLERVVNAAKPGLVYVATRKHAEKLVEALRERSVKAAFYHAGLKAGEREQTQESFMMDEIEVMVATTAFGMGIDKPNVRFVFHYDISDSIDSYYQEIGRAGRDGEEAQALLFYYPKDLGIRHFFASHGSIDVEQVEQVAIKVLKQQAPQDPRELHAEVGLSQTKTMQILTYLQEIGVLEMLATGEVVPGQQAFDLNEVADEVVNMQNSRREFERSRIAMMSGYAELTACRRQYLLNYFGEELATPCGFCDNCDAGLTSIEDEESFPFPINTRVVHPAWGEGMVLRYEGDKMVVLFDEVGYKTLVVELVIEKNLLERLR